MKKKNDKLWMTIVFRFWLNSFWLEHWLPNTRPGKRMHACFFFVSFFFFLLFMCKMFMYVRCVYAYVYIFHWVCNVESIYVSVSMSIYFPFTVSACMQFSTCVCHNVFWKRVYTCVFFFFFWSLLLWVSVTMPTRYSEG